MLAERYNGTTSKFPLVNIPVGELVIFKLEPFTKSAIKKDPSLKDSEPTLYGVGMVAKHLKKATRVANVWPDYDGFGAPTHYDLKNADLAVWVVESAKPIRRIEEGDPGIECLIRARYPGGWCVDYRFMLPRGGQPDHYRATTSFNASSNYWASLTAKAAWKGVVLSMKRVEDTAYWDTADSVVQCKDIWSAYEKVGYLYKTKKIKEGWVHEAPNHF